MKKNISASTSLECQPFELLQTFNQSSKLAIKLKNIVDLLPQLIMILI